MRCLRLGPWIGAAFAALSLLVAGCAQSAAPGVPLVQAPAPVRGDSVDTAVKLYVLDSNLYTGAPSVAVFGRNADSATSRLRAASEARERS
jgi:hypothetical protein